MDFLETDIDITHLSNYKTPATASYFLHVRDKKLARNIPGAIKYITERNLPHIVLTGGTNSLFAFNTYPGLVIHVDIQGWDYNQETKILSCSAGDKIWDVASSLENDYGQNIWHRFIGLPGSIAGAIYGNAGCFGLETANNFLDVEIMDIFTGDVMIYQKQNMNFGYRSSILKTQKNHLILSARFDLSKIHEKYSSEVDNIKFREEIQPKGNSCGSFFKNPSKEFSAGFYIEQVGLKGYKIGGAYFSQKHANFLMHDGNGTHEDLLQLIYLAQSKVEKMFGLRLENEVQIIYP